MGLITIDVLTDGSGDFTTRFASEGFLEAIRYVPDGTVPLATGADISLVGSLSGHAIYSQADIGTAAYFRAPRQFTAGQDGVVGIVTGYIWIGNENLIFTVAQGGSAKRGKFYLWVS